MNVTLARAALAEFLATALLLAVVVGSGIMGERLAGGNVAVALLGNSLATAGGLIALILVFGPVSGAHMNPAVTLAEACAGSLPWPRVATYLAAQIAGAFAGTALANVMFGLQPFFASTHERAGIEQGLGEFVATYGLLLVVLGVSRSRPPATPFAVAAVILAGYWFTSSTSFANPAVAMARAATDTFAGIRPADVPQFVVAELLGTAAALLTFRFVLQSKAAA